MIRRVVVALILAATLPAPTLGLSDQPNTCGGATTESATNTWLSESIGSSTDQDWYRFTVASEKYYLITLGDLPANYRLDLYSACGTTLVGSNRTGRTYEEIYRRLAAGTYRIRVSGVNGATSASPYVLRIRPLAEGVAVLSSSSWTSSSYLYVAGEILNNTVANRQFVKVTATLYNAPDQVVGTDFTYTYHDVIKARARGSFLLLATLPAGYHHMKLTVSSSTTSTQPVSGLALSPGVRSIDTFGWLHYPGEVTNTTGAAIDFVQVILTMYSGRGAVKNVEFTFTDPYTIDAGATNPFDIVVFDHYAGTNRYVLTVN